MLTYLGFACPEFLSAVYDFEIFSSCLVVGAMKNQRHLLSVPVSHSSDCLQSLLPRASEATVTHFPTPSNFSSPSPSTTPHLPPPLPLPGNSLAVARQRPSCLPLFSSTCFTCPLDLSRPSSFPHLFFPSLPHPSTSLADPFYISKIPSDARHLLCDEVPSFYANPSTTKVSQYHRPGNF